MALTDVSKTYSRAESAVVHDVDLVLAAQALTAIVGPSGCGKTTTLKMIAGLLDPDSGDVTFDGQSVLGVPAERRPVGMVFQKPLLFPHLTVAENVAFGLRMRRVPRRDRDRRVSDMLELVQLPGFESRRVHELSGGQEQRVALARALVPEPRVLLLDEPFSQLDANLRGEMRALVRLAHDELDVTTVFVTHDQEEAVELADRIALMIDGRIEQHAEPREFFERPATLSAARFFGAGNTVSGTVHGAMFDCALGRLVLAEEHPAGPAVLVVRQEALRLVEGTGRNTVQGRVTAAEYRGTHIAVTVAVGDIELELTAGAGVEVPVGALVSVQLPPASCRVVPAPDTDRR